MQEAEGPNDKFGRPADASTPEADLQAAQEKIAQLERENMQMHSELDMASNISGVPIIHSQHVEGLGKFIIPAENTLQNHFSLIYDRDNLLDFSADQSPAFDGIIAQNFNSPAFGNPEHPHYFDYEPLRDNISVVRNYAMQSLLSQHDIRDPDELYTVSRKMEQMGREIGVALQRDSVVFSRPGSVKLSAVDASMPGTGAAMIYDLLHKKQESGKSFPSIKRMFGYDYPEWNLAPIEASPFSKANVDAFCLTHPPQAEPDVAPEIAPEIAPQPEAAPETKPETGLSQAQKIAALGTGIAGAAFSLDRVHALSQPVKTRSVELAREILDKLRVTLGGTSQDQWLELPAEAAMQANESLQSISSVYADLYQTALQANPALEQDATMQQSNAAMGKLAYLMKQQAGMKLLDEGRANEASQIMQELEAYPANWRPAPDESPDALLAQVQIGMEQAQAALQAPAQPALAELQQQAPSAAAQLQQLLQNGNLSPQELAAIRDMQAQANSMQADAPIEQLQKHAKKAERETAASVAPEGGYRKAVQQPQAEAQIKR